MNIVDLLVTIVVVTILVTIILAVVTYIAYKLRLSREPSGSDAKTGPQYFVPYPPPNPPTVADHPATVGSLTADSPIEERVSAGVAALEAHATEA